MMSSSPGPVVLRPLGIGEVLDRAVTVCVRFFVPLALVYLVFAIPFAIVQYFAGRDLAHVIAVITQVLQQRGPDGKIADPSAVARALSGGLGVNGWTFLATFMAFFVLPLPVAALMETISAAYLGRAVAFGSAYRVALGRWLPLVGVNLLFTLVGALLYVTVAIVAFVLALAVVFLYQQSHPAGTALGIVLGIAFALALFAFAIVATLAYHVTYFTCVCEGVPAAGAFRLGIVRVFTKTGLSRALLFGLGYVAIAFGIGVVSLAGNAVLLGLVHSEAAAAVYTTVVSIATAAFATTFIGIFYFDLRVREEGFDLQLAARAASVPVAP